MAAPRRRTPTQLERVLDALLTVRGLSPEALSRRTRRQVSTRTVYAVLAGAPVSRAAAKPLAEALSIPGEELHPCALTGLQDIPTWALVHAGEIPAHLVAA